MTLSLIITSITTIIMCLYCGTRYQSSKELRQNVLTLQNYNGGNLCGLSYKDFVKWLGSPNGITNYRDYKLCSWSQLGYSITCTFDLTDNQEFIGIQSEYISDECQSVEARPINGSNGGLVLGFIGLSIVSIIIYYAVN